MLQSQDLNLGVSDFKTKLYSLSPRQATKTPGSSPHQYLSQHLPQHLRARIFRTDIPPHIPRKTLPLPEAVQVNLSILPQASRAPQSYREGGKGRGLARGASSVRRTSREARGRRGGRRAALASPLRARPASVRVAAGGTSGSQPHSYFTACTSGQD